MITIPPASRFPAARSRVESPASYQTAVSNITLIALNDGIVDLHVGMRMATELTSLVVAAKWKLKERLMTTQRAEVICDSIGEHSPRLTTFRIVQPRSLHAELLRHRMLSFSAGSSRALPIATYLRESIANAYVPAFHENQKGMAAGEPFSPDKQVDAEQVWQRMMLSCAAGVETLAAMNASKGDANRPLEWFGWIPVLLTGVEDAWLNFFGLRLDKAAHPGMRELAELMWAAWNESTPKKLAPGQWHLPFVRGDLELIDDFLPPGNSQGLTPHDQMIRISVARCARVSYQSFETGKRSTVEEDLKLYERLVGSQPLHASPAEHQATPQGLVQSELWGNLPYWTQYRKTMTGERIAPLPEGYIYKKP